MKHFSEEDWADFVRDLVAPEMRMTMQQHINDGCNQCGATLRLWQSVLSVAREESRFTPPGDTVRVVKSQFVGSCGQSQTWPAPFIRFRSATSYGRCAGLSVRPAISL